MHSSSPLLTSTPDSSRHSLTNALCAFALFALIVAIYAAIPFYSIPVIGQAMWVSAFARAFEHSGWLALFAHNFGYPNPAPMAFGLPGALVQAVLLRITSLRPTDAYSCMIILYLALANWGAIRFAQQIGLRYRMALVAAAIWLTAPVVWAHAGYSMLSIGIALMPLYVSQALRVSAIKDTRVGPLAIELIAFAAIATLSLFIDGYTFVMFAIATFIVLAVEALAHARARLKTVLLASTPVCAVGFVIAYALYVSYIGHVTLQTEPLDFFRGWGADVTMLLMPTKGEFWLWDHIGIARDRNDVFYYGDTSVWMTTFSLLIGVFGCVGFWLVRTNRTRAATFLVIAIVGTYLSLGPSLKVHSLRPKADIAAGQFSPLMPATAAVMPTGTAFLSAHVPGFRNMRASYRWIVLGLLGFWALYALLLAELDRRNLAWVAIVLAAFTVIGNLPKHGVTTPASLAHPEIGRLKLRAPHHWWKSLQDIDANLVPSFRHNVREGSVVAFVPAGNDFLAGYLAAEANVKTFNTGGDKNVEIARAGWPDDVKTLLGSDAQNALAPIKQVLDAHDADTVVIPFIDLLWDAHEWPPADEQVAARRARWSATLAQLENDPRLTVSSTLYFAFVSLRGH